MADIFISYSRRDRSHAVKLSAFLEAQGYSTWWDRDLDAAATYRDQIMRELQQARAVVVVWSKHSTESDFVRAEASQAYQQKKLVPVRTDEIAYESIPLPFGELHTPNASDETVVLQAIQRLLALPVPTLSRADAFLKAARYEVILWAAIVMGALTLASNLQAFLNLSIGSRWIVTNWVSLLQRLWSALLFFLDVRISGYDAAFLTIFALVAISIAQSCTFANGQAAVGFQRRRYLYVALLIVGGILLSSFSAVSTNKLATASRHVDNYVAELFSDNPQCKNVVSQYAHRYLGGDLTARILSGSMSAEEAKDLTRLLSEFEACAQLGNVDENKLRDLASKRIASYSPGDLLWRDSEQVPSVTLSVYMAANAREGLARVCLMALLLMPVALPFGALAIARRLFRIEVRVAELSRRIWRMIVGACVLVALNYVALFAERSDVSAMGGRREHAIQEQGNERVAPSRR